jgi:alpha-L-fucosidase
MAGMLSRKVGLQQRATTLTEFPEHHLPDFRGMLRIVQLPAASLSHDAEQLLLIAVTNADGGGDDAAGEQLAGVVGQLSVIGHAIIGLTVREQNHPCEATGFPA